MAIVRSLKGLFCGLILTGLLWTPALADRAPLAELWFQTSAEYRATAYQTYRMAEFQFERWSDILVKGPDGKAYLPGSDKPVAIVLDLDETVIDNSGYQAFTAKNDLEFNEELWALWVEFQGINQAAGPLVPGALEFLAKIEAMGVTPIYISNRTTGQEGSTINVLKRAGINVDNIHSRILLRLPSKEETTRGEAVIRDEKIDKNSELAMQVMKGEGKKEARRRLTAQKYNIIAYFGDQLGDFEGYVQKTEIDASSFKDRRAVADEYRQYWGTTWFMLSNPMYGYWGPGQSLPAKDPENSMQDYGFDLYVRGQRVPAGK